MTLAPPSPKRRELFEALAQLETPLECQKFLLDLCTPAELDSMADRWLVAKLLSQNIPYRTIHEKTGTSTATVTRVARAMNDGEGYRFLLSRQSQLPLRSQPPQRLLKHLSLKPATLREVKK